MTLFSAPRNHRRRGLYSVAAAILTGFAAGAVRGADGIIIKDDFHDTDEAEYSQPMTGRPPSLVNHPKGTWQLASGDGDYEARVQNAGINPANPQTAMFHNLASAAISLAGNGDYAKPARLVVSADLYQEDASCDYVLLGFYSERGGEHNYDPLLHFTGLKVNVDGSVALVENGTAQPAVAWSGGTFNPSMPTKVSFEVDTTKGTIANVTVDGSGSRYAFTTAAFTDGATAYAGIGGKGNSNASVFADNFTVSAGTGR